MSIVTRSLFTAVVAVCLTSILMPILALVPIDAFAADPDWKRVRQESIDRHGHIASVVQMALFKATDYSPVR